jgi:hypothetical protein
MTAGKMTLEIVSNTILTSSMEIMYSLGGRNSPPESQNNISFLRSAYGTLVLHKDIQVFGNGLLTNNFPSQILNKFVIIGRQIIYFLSFCNVADK